MGDKINVSDNVSYRKKMQSVAWAPARWPFEKEGSGREKLLIEKCGAVSAVKTTAYL